MKILFVSSGNSNLGISPIVKNQSDSLQRIGLEIDHFTIKGKGLMGYLKNVKRLKEQFFLKKYDIIHAHYSLSGFIVSLANVKVPIVVSLMGSDVMSKSSNKYLINVFYKYTWNSLIVKSKSLSDKLQIKMINIVPNGVNFNMFKPIDKLEAMNRIGWNSNKKHILFPAHKSRVEKNFDLAQDSFNKINTSNIELHYLDNVDHDIIPFYINASDVILLTSFWEGSPNVIKEAMACNRPIVSTDVGDVKHIIQNTKGCFVCSNDSNDIIRKISQALKFKNTNGRIQIDYLRDNLIAKKILSIYKKINNEK